MQKILNLGILAHVDAGKTTVTEGILVHSGVKRQGGRVDDGTTTTDSMALERKRGMTIRAATVSFIWQGVKINLIDTPGHMDFIAEVERSLAVLDGAVLVISAREGVQPQTRVIFEKLVAMRVPTLLFINKIDRVGARAEAVCAQIRQLLTPNIVPMQRTEGEGSREAAVFPLSLCEGVLLETLADADEALLSAYLSDAPLTEADARAALRRQTHACALYPLYLGAALRDVGIMPLLDGIVTHLTPDALPAINAPLSAYLYKIEWDAQGRKCAYARVFSGALRLRDRAAHLGHDAPVHLRGLLRPVGGAMVPTDCIEAGDIGLLADIAEVRCGDFLGERHPLPVGISPTEPLLSVQITPPPDAGRAALLDALTRLTEEDPALQLAIRADTEEITLRLYGLLQREIIEALLLERFGLRAVFSPVRTLMREQPMREARAEMRLGQRGNLHAAGIALTLTPLPTGRGNAYVRNVSYGDLSRSFQNGVEEGVWQGLREGLGHEIVDTQVTFTDMDFSSVTSTPADYRRLAPEVLRRALASVPLRRLEPWVAFTLTTPAEFQKKVLPVLNPLRAIVQSITHGETECVVRGEAPLDTTKQFAAQLQALTRGQGGFGTVFLAYREVGAL
ncbi:MAG: TetM/TetW/TetO/TetS family tetracycline resistance ribosomal protection protein [Oscillospiraceae bacterium]|nr:TetM/TetW/TetO/TetS family tetracycline resistance ribosomal protection protein [Oscillospiraceae bacterium]